MKEALFYINLTDKVQCRICPRNCIILEGQRGFCRARENIKNKLYSLVYARPCSINLDPIEKKPLYHFYPSHRSLSVATVGCNMACKHCQNWEISQADPDSFPARELMPEQIVNMAVKGNYKSISYTYTEPTIFYEYVLDTAKLAKKKGIKNVIVSNGFINPEPLVEWCKYIDAANIDLKFFDDAIYREMTTAWLDPILETIKTLHKKKVWLEITNLIIPALNDKPKMIEKMCKWITDNIGVSYPLHFTAFYPTYKLNNTPPTSTEMLLKARGIALKAGIKYVYVGNVYADEANNTYCPKCKRLLIERSGFSVMQNNIKKGKCSCGNKIDGLFSSQ